VIKYLIEIGGVSDMDFNAVTQFISSLGFPIAVCLICFWYINKREEQHKEELTKLSEALNNNTLVMQKLVDRLGDVDDEK
jgi:hypothetical protein